MLTFLIDRRPRVGSTSDEARRLAAAGAPPGLVITAAEQTAGRGRHGRGWTSPVGNLYASVLLEPAVPPARLPELGFVAAVAVAELLSGFLPAGTVGLKWPNDVLARGAKIAGLLVEQAAGMAILGMGINLAVRPEDTPYPATALAAEGVVLSPEAALQRLLESLGSWLARWEQAGFAPVRAAWLARAHPAGTMLRVRLGGPAAAGVLEGTFAGLDADGTLLLDTEGGRRRIAAGEVLA
ncbi:MAG: biotin--[acetyl-CoA-carboxylase] ligase [Acetobacteraceae bacterium]